MKHRFHRSLAAVLAAALFGQSLPAALAVSGSNTEGDSVSITESVFPDAAFRSWLTNASNINGYGADGLLTPDEINNIQSINVASLNLKSLEGIEVFTALEKLDCKNNALTALDVSKNTALKYLHCAFNRILSLDVSGLANLISLNCESNNMKSLNLDGCTALEIIYCRNNSLPSVDFSTNTKLKFIETFDNQLTSVDLSKLTALEFVHLDHNLLTELDLSHNANLSPIGSGFVARNNQLNTLTLPDKSDLMVEADVYAEQDPKKGYERTAWYLDQSYQNKVPDPVQASGQTLYVKWLPNDYTISYAPNGGSGTMASQKAVWDSKVSLSENSFSRTGYQFVNWKNTFGDGQTYAAGQEVTNIGGDVQGDRVTLYAQWNPISYKIAFDANGGSGTMSDVEMIYNTAEQLPQCTLTAPDGKEFAGWSLSSNGSVKYFDQTSVRNLTANADETVTLYAVWRNDATNEYLSQLDKSFSSYQPNDYTAQDWTKLTGIYTTAREALASAQPDDRATVLSQAQSSLSQVLTLESRADQAAQQWRSEYRNVIGQVNAKAVDETNAASVFEQAVLAADGLTAAFVQSHTDLTQAADQQLVAVRAAKKTEETVAGLRSLAEAAQWAATLGGLSTRPMGEVTSTALPAYEAAVQQAKGHTAQFSTSLTNALQQRAELAQCKQQSATQLHMEYSSYDLSQYTEDGAKQLENILHTAIAAMEQAQSVSSVSSLLTKAQQDMRAVPDSSGQTPPVGGNNGNGNNGGGAGGGAGGEAGGGGAAGGGAGGGGAAGGGTAPSPDKPADSAVSLPVTGTADASGKVFSAQVPADKLNQSVQNALQAAQSAGTAPVVRVAVEADAAETVQLSLPADALSKLGADKQAAFVMDSPVGSVALDASAMTAVAGQAGSRTLTLVLSSAAQARRSAAPAAQWSWKLLVDGSELTDLRGGTATIQVPHTLGAQQQAAGVVVYTLDAAGEAHAAQTNYDTEHQMVSFAAMQPCSFTVGYDKTRVWQNTFSDISEQAWYYDAVRYVCANGMMNGNSAASFSPEQTLSRAQLAQILYNREGRPAVTQVSFADVSQNAWYASAIGWATQAGVLTGYGNGRIGPEDPVTREQLAAMLYRYAGQKGYDTSAQADLSSFADAASVSAYAQKPLAWAHAQGIVNGTSTATLSPGGSATRAQAAMMLMQFGKNVSA